MNAYEVHITDEEIEVLRELIADLELRPDGAIAILNDSPAIIAIKDLLKRIED